jgi:hypothetical protein
MRHGGEAQAARDSFNGQSRANKNLVLAFLTAWCCSRRRHRVEHQQHQPGRVELPAERARRDRADAAVQQPGGHRVGEGVQAPSRSKHPCAAVVAIVGASVAFWALAPKSKRHKATGSDGDAAPPSAAAPTSSAGRLVAAAARDRGAVARATPILPAPNGGGDERSAVAGRRADAADHAARGGRRRSDRADKDPLWPSWFGACRDLAGRAINDGHRT